MPRPVTVTYRVFASPAATARAGAQLFSDTALKAATARGVARIAISGGTTPKSMFQLLADPAEPFLKQVPWDRIELYWVDERCVPPDNAESNYRMTKEALLSKVPLAAERVHRMEGELEPEVAAARYESVIRNSFKLEGAETPTFDLVLLGMGDEGHTLSLFPGTKALHPGGRIVVRNWVGKFFTERITITAETANHANRVMFMITRADKAAALKAVLEGPYEPEQLPAQFIQPTSGNALWLIDRDAAKMLSVGIRE